MFKQHYELKFVLEYSSYKINTKSKEQKQKSRITFYNTDILYTHLQR